MEMEKAASILRFVGGYIFKTVTGITDEDVTEIRKDFERLDDVSSKKRFTEQIVSWTGSLDQEAVELYGESWTILRFGDDDLRRELCELWWIEEAYLPTADEGCWRRAASTVIKYRGVNINAWAEREARARLIAEYRGLSRMEWVFCKDSLQKLIAAGEGGRLDPGEVEYSGYEAMFGLMARAAWNAARCDHGRQLCVPPAKSISDEAEKLIRRWEMRRMV